MPGSSRFPFASTVNRIRPAFGLIAVLCLPQMTAAQPPGPDAADLDSLRMELQRLGRAQAEEMRRLAEARRAEFEEVREEIQRLLRARRAELEAMQENLLEANRELAEARREITEARREAFDARREALETQRETMRSQLDSLGLRSGPRRFRGAGFFAPERPSAAGAELTSLNAALARYFGVETGVLVIRVREESPAARAGLLPGDVLVEIDGRPVDTVAEARLGLAPLRTPQAADGVPIRVVREGASLELRMGR